MTLSIQFGIDDTSDEQPKEEQPEQQHQFAQFHNGAVSVNPATGESTHYTTTTVSAADFAGRHGGGVLATAQTRFGSPVMGNLTADCLVTYQGTQMTLREAEALELVHRRDGRYIEGPAGAPAEQQEPTKEGQTKNDFERELFHAEYENRLQDIVKDVEPSALDSTHAEIAALFAETGGFEGLNLEKVASRTGLSVEHARNYVAGMVAGFATQVDALLEKSGLGQDSGEALIEWARSARTAQLKAAVSRHALARNTSGWRELIGEYIRRVAPNADALTKAGYQTMRDPKSGELLVKVGDMWTSVRSAARQGHL